MSIRARCCLIILLCLAMSACSGLHAKPDLSLVDVGFGKVSLLETDLEVTLRLQNESPDPLNIHGAVYKLYFNDSYIGKGMSSDNVRVPGLGSSLQHVTVSVNNLSLFRKIQNLVETGNFDYRVEGLFYGPLGRLAGPLRVENGGRFAARDFGFPGRRRRDYPYDSGRF